MGFLILVSSIYQFSLFWLLSFQSSWVPTAWSKVMNICNYIFPLNFVALVLPIVCGLNGQVGFVPLHTDGHCQGTTHWKHQGLLQSMFWVLLSNANQLSPKDPLLYVAVSWQYHKVLITASLQKVLKRRSINSPTLSSLFKIVLVLQGHMYFHMYFKISLFIFTRRQLRCWEDHAGSAGQVNTGSLAVWDIS